MNCFRFLARDERAFAVSIELMLVATVALLGLIVGLTAARDAVTSELSDVARAVQNGVQSYAFHGIEGHSSSTGGSDYLDLGDHCNTGFRDRRNRVTNCIQIRRRSMIEESRPLRIR